MIQPGERLQWLHVPRDGYGYTLRVPCRFVRSAPFAMVVVDIVKADGAVVRKRIDEKRLLRASDGANLIGLQRQEQTA